MKDLTSIPGVRALSPTQYAFERGTTLSAVVSFLETVSENGDGVAFYDLKYPSPTDPGAYLAFFKRSRADSDWRLTLGNHGWSGGAYVVPQDFIQRYLLSLIAENAVESIMVGDVGSKHFADESTDRSDAIINRIRELHRF